MSWIRIAMVATSTLVLHEVTALLAQTGGDFELSPTTVDGGGSLGSGGDFELQGTIGQPDARSLIGGSFELNGGFWPAAFPQTL